MNNENFNVESDEEEDNIYQSDEDINWDNVGAAESYIANHEINTYSPLPSEAPNIEYDQNMLTQQATQNEEIESNFNDDASKISKKQAAMELVYFGCVKCISHFFRSLLLIIFVCSVSD